MTLRIFPLISAFCSLIHRAALEIESNALEKSTKVQYNFFPRDWQIENKAYSDVISHRVSMSQTFLYSIKRVRVMEFNATFNNISVIMCILANPTDLRGRLPIFNLFYRLPILNNILPVL